MIAARAELGRNAIIVYGTRPMSGAAGRIAVGDRTAKIIAVRGAQL
jgi:hypothetical protein